MKIDKDSPGLMQGNGYYILDGDLIYKEELTIKIPLFVKGRIKAEDWIEAVDWIKAGTCIEAGTWIEAGCSIKAEDWIEMYGIKTKNLYLINGTFTFDIWVMDTHVKIGCHLKTKKEWLEIIEKELVDGLGDDWAMWEHREFIKMLCKE